MRAPREFVFSCEHMGGTTWTVEHQWAIEGEAEEVVRCGECKFYLEEHKWCYHFDDSEFCPEPNGFCAWGERRDA